MSPTLAIDALSYERPFKNYDSSDTISVFIANKNKVGVTNSSLIENNLNMIGKVIIVLF